MKQTLKNNLIVVSLYILAGFIFNGYLPYMLVVFLVLSATVSYFLYLLLYIWCIVLYFQKEKFCFLQES